MTDGEELRRPRSRRRHVRYGTGVAVVAPEEFVTRDEAAEKLGKVSVGWLEVHGVLERAVLDDGQEGVTVRSVEREIAWQAEATVWMRLRRTVGQLFRLPWMI